MDQSIEAMWSATFLSSANVAGAGVVVLETGHVLGGDSAFSYVGKYMVEHGELIASILVRRHSTIGSMSAVFPDLPEFKLALRGKVDYHEMSATGRLVDFPDRYVSVILRRHAELP